MARIVLEDQNMFSSSLLTISAMLLAAQGDKTGKMTYTYKTAGTCAIKADVYPVAGDKPHPAVIWIHGGALIMGSREQVDRALLAKLTKAGYVVVSIDYRLAPE